MLSTYQTALLASLMTHDDQQFFKELSSHIAPLRKDIGVSQQAGAEVLQIPQQTYANYEVARARPAVSMLPTLAQLFGISVDELLGLHRSGAAKRGPTPLLQKQIERLSLLPKAQQKVVLKMLEGVLDQSR
jgi:transcriptional regulator with XRE-family HTH domain